GLSGQPVVAEGRNRAGRAARDPPQYRTSGSRAGGSGVPELGSQAFAHPARRAKGIPDMTGQRSWSLSTPALVLFGVLLVVPLIMTFVLSFNSFDFYEGISNDISLANYKEVLGDSYFYEIFARTFAIALATTVICAIIGVPQAYFLNRMTPFWRSVMVLVTLGPLLISVVVRTLGWAILLGNKGVINTALTDFGLIERPVKMMYTSGGIVLALVHVMIPFMVLAVWASLQRQDPATEAAAESLGAGR